MTNNSEKNVDVLLKKFRLEFDCVICRESGLWKPSGAPLRAALRKLRVEKEASCAVGDSHFDVKAAEEAGIQKIFILPRQELEYSPSAEIVQSVAELQQKISQLL